MITVYNNKYQEKYDILFREAYNVLIEEQKKPGTDITLNENVAANQRIASLEEYFAHIGYLAEYHSRKIREEMASNATYQQSAKFLMLPMDEKHDVEAGCFYVDLNTRNINVPTSYAKYGVSVTGDQMAETLMFKVPRYFDYTDLTSTEIYVQWTRPDGEEGASRIVLVDYESEEGYILFGWPLTSNITVEGNNPLKFAIRFLVRDTEKNIKYSLNTLSASVAIKQALYTQFNSDLKVDDPSTLFAEAILNGVDTNMVLPKTPAFFGDWVLPESVNLVNDTIDLEVQGDAPDLGLIRYTWFFTPRYIDAKNNVVVEEAKTAGYKITAQPQNMTYIATKDITPKEEKTYYTQDGNDYPVFDGNEFAEGVTYYEAVCKYTIFASTASKDEVMEPNKVAWPHVTGTYECFLENGIGSNWAPAENKSVCVVPCVESISFKSDLNDNAVIDMVDDSPVKASLSVLVDVQDTSTIGKEDAVSAAEKAYTWYMKETSDGEFNVVGEADEEGTIIPYTGSSIMTDKRGWYKVKATGTLNRESMWIESNECKVTYPVEAPKILNHLIDGNVQIVANDAIAKSIPFETPVTLTVEINPLAELESDEIIYTWYADYTDDNEKKLEVNNKEVLAINGNSIQVQVPKTGDSDPHYYCHITNKLAGEEKMTKSATYYLISAGSK